MSENERFLSLLGHGTDGSDGIEAGIIKKIVRQETTMLRKSMRQFAVVTVILFCVSVQGCSTYRVHAPHHPGVIDDGEVVWSLAWGLIQEKPKVECNDQALAEVTVKSNFAFDLLTVVTLGFMSPKKVEWKCARAKPSTGTF